MLIDSNEKTKSFEIYKKEFDSDWQYVGSSTDTILSGIITDHNSIILLQHDKVVIIDENKRWGVDLPERHDFEFVHAADRNIYLLGDTNLLQISWDFDDENQLYFNKSEFPGEFSNVKKIKPDGTGKLYALDKLGRIGEWDADHFNWRDVRKDGSVVSIFDIVAIENGLMWAITNKGHLLGYALLNNKSYFIRDNKSKEKINLPVTYIRATGTDGNNIWYADAEGLIRIPILKQTYSTSPIRYGPDEGVETGTFDENYMPSYLSAIPFHIASNNEVFWWDEKTAESDFHPPVLVIEKIIVQEKEVPTATLSELDYEQNDIRIYFQGIHLTKGQDILYQWRLRGRDKFWSPLTKQSYCEISNLKRGNYLLEISALVGKSSDVIQIPIKINPPFWKVPRNQFIMILISLIGIIGIGGILYRHNLKRLKRKNEILKRDKKLLQLERKALQLQMNPHFIFNLLNTVQSKLDSTEARKVMTSFSRLMREFLNQSRSQSIVLDEEIRSIQNYLELERFSRGKYFEFGIECSSELEVEFIKIPPMLIQPFVENAIIHGLSNIEDKGIIKITFHEESGYLHCRIEDNGIGRKASAQLQLKKGTSHQSHAIDIIMERLNLLDDNSSVVIRDRIIGGSIEGTIVELKIKIVNEKQQEL